MLFNFQVCIRISPPEGIEVDPLASSQVFNIELKASFSAAVMLNAQ